jgi:hypothetical protein
MNNTDTVNFHSYFVPTSLELDGTRAHLTVGPCNKEVLRALVSAAQRFTIHQTPDGWVVMKRIAGGECDAVLGIEAKDFIRSAGEESILSLTLWHQPSVGQRRKMCERPADMVTLTTTAEPEGAGAEDDYALPLVFEFTRTEVEQLNFKRFLQTFAPNDLPSGSVLGEVRGKTTFLINGYDNDSRELWEIPEVRRFCRAWWKAWPFAFFFADLSNKALLLIFMCCMDSIRGVHRDGDLFGHVYFQMDEMRERLEQDFIFLRALDYQACISENESVARLQAVVTYLTTRSLAVAPSGGRSAITPP